MRTIFKAFNILTLVLAAALVAASGDPSAAREFPLRHLAFEDGLPSNTVYQVYRDRQGFIWIGTDKGVARYNGVRFEVFNTASGLADNEIYMFREDQVGRLWMATSNGKLCYYHDGIFYSEKNDPALKLSFANGQIGYISVEKDSSVMISFFDWAKMVNVLKDGRVKEYDMTRMRLPFPVREILTRKKVSADKFVLFFRSGRCTMDTLGNIDSTNSARSVAGKSLDSGWMRITLAQDQEFALNYKYFYTSDVEIAGRIRREEYLRSHVTIYNDGRNYFFTTNKGVFVNDTVGVLEGASISSITQDEVGNYWIGDLSNGIWCLRKDFMSTRLYRNIYGGRIDYCIAQGGELYYVDASDNLLRLNGGKPVPIINNMRIPARDPSVFSGAYLLDSNYNYYSFLNIQTIVIPDIRKKNRTVFQYPGGFLKSVKTAVPDGNDFYLRTMDNVVRLKFPTSRNTDSVKYQYLADNGGADRISDMAMDNKKHIWYSTITSMFRVEGDRYLPQPQLKNCVLKKFSFVADHLVGYTFDGRLVIISDYDATRPKVETYAGNCVWNNMYKLNDSMLLLSTNNFDRVLTVHNGAAQVPFSVSVIEDPFVPLNIDAFCTDGIHGYFFKQGDLTVLDINSLMAKNPPPKLFFSTLTAGKKNYPLSGDVALSYSGSRNITISFITASFAGKDVSYQYSFSHGDDNWMDVKGEAINLADPGYGDYAVKVRARTATSEFSKPVSFSLYIARPYWATWWFVLLAMLVGFGLVAIAVRYRISYIVSKNEKLHDDKIKFMKLEYRALNAMMNPHFIFNSLNNLQSLINKNEKLAANRYLGVFSDLIRQNMHNVSQELIPLHKEMEIVENYLKLEKLRFKELMNFEIRIDQGIDISEILVPPLLVQPLVENSVKHGIYPRKSADSYVQVHIFERDGSIVISVKDNGIGIEAALQMQSAAHQSTGLDNIRKRIAQLSVIQNKQITLDISEQKGDNDQIISTTATIAISLS